MKNSQPRCRRNRLNQNSCGACHNTALGGSGSITVRDVKGSVTIRDGSGSILVAGVEGEAFDSGTTLIALDEDELLANRSAAFAQVAALLQVL